ncbi:MAG: hypothetical protein WC527_05875 [Candidatus Margulisiibacteriota bacterium]
MGNVKKTKKVPKTKKPTKKAKKEKLVGKIEHIFEKIHVVTTTLKNPIKVGDIIHIKGHTTDLVQTVESMQIEHEDVQKAKKGDGVGIKISGIVRDTDNIYLADKKTALSQKPNVSINPIIPKKTFLQPKNTPPIAKDSPTPQKFFSF